MLLRSFIALLAIIISLTVSFAQSGTEEDKAYRAALRLADPQQKIAALEKLLAENPHGTYRVLVNRNLLEILVEFQPEQATKILAQANRLIGLVSEAVRGNWYSTIAGILLDKGILLEDAERFAEQSVAALGDRKNLGQMQQLGSAGGRTIVASNVPRVALLGRIYLQRGKRKEGEALLKEAYAADATQPSALIGMGELAASKGDDKTALENFARAYLSGRGREAARKRVAATYRQVYPTKPDELEAWLDATCRQQYPMPRKPERYQPTAARTNRVVLAEVFTGSACGPCLAADLAFDAALERFTTKELVVLMYHVHIPDVDPLTNPTTEARREFYQVRAAPYPFINGAFQPGIGGSRERAEASFAKLKPVIEAALEVPSAAEIRLSAMQQGPTIKVKVAVDKIRSDSSELRLQLALVEDEVRYTGVNSLRFHPMVVRALAGEQAEGFAVRAAQAASFEHLFDVQKIVAATKAYLDDYEINGRTFNPKFDEKKHEIDVQRLSLVAFLQDSKTKQILQAVYLKLPPAVENPK